MPISNVVIPGHTNDVANIFCFAFVKEMDHTFERATGHTFQINQYRMISLGIYVSLSQELNLLASRLNELHHLGKNCRLAVHGRCDEELQVNFDISAAIGIDYNPEEWQHFIDSSTKGLRPALLHNGNKHPASPIASSVEMKEE